MVLGLTNNAMKAQRDAYNLNKEVKTGFARLERRSGSGRSGHTKKGGAGGSGTWGGAMNQYDLDAMDAWEQDDDEVVEKRAPAFANTWMEDFEAKRQLETPVPRPVALQPKMKNLIVALINDFSSQQKNYAPKKLKKDTVYNGKNDKMCRANLRHPRVQSRNGVRVGQPNPACRCH